MRLVYHSSTSRGEEDTYVSKIEGNPDGKNRDDLEVSSNYGVGYTHA